jgi:hypothetical protein
VTMSAKFEPKTQVELNPPKDDLISIEDLALCDGTSAPCSRGTRASQC